MSTSITDNFTSDTGQITTFVPIVNSGGPPWTAGATEAITGNQMVISLPAAAGSDIVGLVAQENGAGWAVSSSSVLVIARPGTPTWLQPLPSGSAHYGPGLVKDASNFIVFESGPDISTTTFTCFIYGNIAGAAFAASATINTTVLPDAVAFGLSGNQAFGFVLFGTTWQQILWSGQPSVDVSSHYDFTAAGAMVGWQPGIVWGANAGTPPMDFATGQLQSTQPFVNPITGTTVPNVVTDTESDAIAALTAAGLIVGTISTSPSLETVGTVLAQDPPGGTPANIGDPVNITIAVSGVTTIVPDLTNTSLSSGAPTLLAAANLVLGAVTYASSVLIIAGNVIKQSPTAGTTALEGDAVNVTISTGRGPVVVPFIVEDTQTDAMTAITNVGLVVGSVNVRESLTIPAGEVIAQNPQGGTPVASGTLVSFTISSGPPVPAPAFDWTTTVISQYANSPSLLLLCQSIADNVDQTVNFANFYAFVWNVDTAQGFGLDVWGKIVNVSRFLQIPTGALYVGFQDGSAGGTDPVPGGDYDVQPFSALGTWYSPQSATQTYELEDEPYRQLILAKALANISRSTVPTFNQILQRLFPGRGNPYVVNDGAMNFKYVFDFDLTPIELAILNQSGVMPVPPGVSFTIVVP